MDRFEELTEKIVADGRVFIHAGFERLSACELTQANFDQFLDDVTGQFNAMAERHSQDCLRLLGEDAVAELKPWAENLAAHSMPSDWRNQLAEFLAELRRITHYELVEGHQERLEARILELAAENGTLPAAAEPTHASDATELAATEATDGASSGTDRSRSAKESNEVEYRPPPREMLDLAHAWWQTHTLLEQSRRAIKELPARIASEQAKLTSNDGHSNVHWQNLARFHRDLQNAKALLLHLEKQLSALEKQYRESGYDEIPYSTWTTGETFVGGRGIEDVGRAVNMSGTPAGLRPTGIEFDIASAPAVIQVGRAVLKRAAAAARNRLASRPAALLPYEVGRGHHIPAKKAFEGARGYNAKTALAIPNDELARLDVVHSTVTGGQQTLYREFAKTGEQLTWDSMERIETEALVRAGMNPRMARATVKRAIDDLKKAGVSGPTRIPCGD